MDRFSVEILDSGRVTSKPEVIRLDENWFISSRIGIVDEIAIALVDRITFSRSAVARGIQQSQLHLLNKHAISVGVEAVALGDGVVVCAENIFFSAESADQHQEGRLGKVEIRQ